MPPIQSPKGTRDILPADMAAWDEIYATHARVAEAHGYRAIQTPIFEATEMFERGIGAGTDIVDKEMYSFETSGGDRLTLRPEATPATLRAVLGAHLDQERRPVRVHYAGPMFRHDRPQRGRYRQLHQIGVEAIGERSPVIDAEVIEIGWRFYEALGIDGIDLQINSLGDLDDRRRYRQMLVDFYTPHLAGLCDDCRRRIEINPLRLLDCNQDAHLAAIAPPASNALSPASSEYFESVLGCLRDAGITCTINRHLVRGLDYYAHTAFEFWHTSLHGAQNALGGGGRYDGLAEVLGFPATPGVGYALGVDRALIVLQDAGAGPAAATDADVVVCSLGAESVGYAAALARQLRAAGHRVILDAAERRLDRKLRNADRLGARVCVIVGDNELAARTAMVRDLGQRDQQSVAVDAVNNTVTAILGCGGEGDK